MATRHDEPLPEKYIALQVANLSVTLSIASVQAGDVYQSGVVQYFLKSHAAGDVSAPGDFYT